MCDGGESGAASEGLRLKDYRHAAEHTILVSCIIQSFNALLISKLQSLTSIRLLSSTVTLLSKIDTRFPFPFATLVTATGIDAIL